MSRDRDPEPFSLYAPDGARKYLNRDERQRVLAAIEFLEPDQALFALTLAWTGARVSEVLALRPSSFQVELGVVALRTLKRDACDDGRVISGAAADAAQTQAPAVAG